MITFCSIGGNCLGLFISNYLINYSNNVKIVKSPTINMRTRGGFKNVKHLFDGTFKKEWIDNSPVYEYIETNKFPHRWVSKHWFCPHIDYNKPNIKATLLSRLTNTLNYAEIQRSTDSYWFIYCLNKHDIDLTIDEIIKAKEILDKYINTNRLLILGSDRFITEQLTYKGFKVSTNQFQFQNENFAKVFGEHYVVINPSNIYELATQDFIIKFNNLNNGHTISLY